MALQRIIGSIFLQNCLAVQSVGFSRYHPIGDPVVLAETYDQWGVDEIVMIDMTASTEKRLPSSELLDRIMRRIRTPLCVGGGVCSVSDVETLLRHGADRVFINSALQSNSKLASQASSVFGSQCIVAWVDVTRVGGNLKVHSHLHSSSTGLDVRHRMQVLEEAGVGEIILHAVPSDGALSGFDLEIASLAECVQVPVILSGGAGKLRDFIPAFRDSRIAGACAGNMFSHAETVISEVKALLVKEGFAVRPLDK
jgi:cyclase